MDGAHKKKNTNMKKVYGMGDQALALKLLNNMNSRKHLYLEQKKQNQLLHMYNHKKIIKPRRPHHSPDYNRGSSG